MEKFRVDYLTKEEMYISEKRAKRPVSYVKQKNKDFEEISKENCPFCEGKQDSLGAMILNYKNVRVIENTFPALDEKFGKHEVLVESMVHEDKIEYLEDEYCYDIMKTLQLRYENLLEKYDYINIFKNEGVLSGATLYHTHWQIVALNKISQKNNVIYNSFCTFYKEKGYNYFDDKNKENLKLYEGEYFKIIAPYASKFSLMLRIVPKSFVSSFKEFKDDELYELAILLKKILKAYKSELKDISYNFNLHDFYNRKEGCFFLEVLPRFGKFGGFELLTNTYLTSGYGEKTIEILKKYFV